VALLGGGGDAIGDLVTALRDPDQVPNVRGDLALLTGGQITSYRVGPEYTTGSLPIWIYPSWLLRNSPLAIVVVMIVGSALLGLFYYFGLRRRAAIRSRRTPTRRTPL
jgi:cellulose synthase (UDP-forming)